jgi:hypothetical protein
MMLRSAQLRLDRLATQNMLMVQSVPATKEAPLEVSLYGDADRFAADASLQFYRTDTDMAQFHCHEEKERVRLQGHGVQPPTLMSIPAKYQVASVPLPVIHTDINQTETVRQDNVYAVCGVPRTLVNATGKFTSDMEAAFRTMNATIHRIRAIASELFYCMYVTMYPDDRDVQFEVEVDTLITPDNVVSAAQFGLISEQAFGRLYLKCLNIPVSLLVPTLSSTAIPKPLQEPDTVKRKATDTPKATQGATPPKRTATGTA